MTTTQSHISFGEPRTSHVWRVFSHTYYGRNHEDPVPRPVRVLAVLQTEAEAIQWLDEYEKIRTRGGPVVITWYERGPK